jgi:hypothetical protein
VRALEREMRARLRSQGLEDIAPRILVVTRLIPEARGTSCNVRWEHIHGTADSHILRLPFRSASLLPAPAPEACSSAWAALRAAGCVRARRSQPELAAALAAEPPPPPSAHALLCFRTRDGSVLPQWVSRFNVWPYLEQFAAEAQKEVRVWN